MTIVLPVDPRALADWVGLERRRAGQAASEPVLRLLAAILEDALREVARGAATPRARRRAFRDTLAWLRADDERWPFSFVNVCEGLGLDARAIRGAVERLLHGDGRQGPRVRALRRTG
jgi:hypothetical protein